MDVVKHVHEDEEMLVEGLCMSLRVVVSVRVGVCLPVDVCVCACHCVAADLMFFMSPSVREIKRGTELRVSCLIRLG